ncbi:hypothetical protein [Nonomuraea aridisoli]|nr:hypothetical protein [Nonomuraea aridisoli]
MSLRTGLLLSREAARWGLRFHGRHAGMIVGLSMIPTVQRFVAVAWGDDLPAAAGVAGELLTGAVRVLLIFLICRLAFVRDPEVAGLGERWRRVAWFVDHRRGDFLIQFAVLGTAFALFDLVPNLAIQTLAPEGAREWVTAVVVAIKNPTVIAFTFVWMAGVARRMMLAAPEPAGAR